MKRDEVVPLAWWAAFIVLMYVVVSASIAPAGATPTVGSPGEVFAAEHGVDICLSLDARPTIPGVLGVLTSLDTYGLSPHEAGVAVSASVTTICPIHANLLRQFVARYKQDRGKVA